MLFFLVVTQLVPEPDLSSFTGESSSATTAAATTTATATEEERKADEDDDGGSDSTTKATRKQGSAKKLAASSSSSSSSTAASSSSSPASAVSASAAADDLKKTRSNEQYLLSVGILTAIGISLHNFPEGIAVYISCMRGPTVGLPLALAIAAHNIPEGMAVASPIFNATKSKWTAFKYTLLSGMCEPIGALVFGLFFTQSLSEDVVHAMLAGVAGIMVLMAIKELLPTSLRYISADSAVVSHIIGMAFIFFSIWLLHHVFGFCSHIDTLQAAGEHPASASASKQPWFRIPEEVHVSGGERAGGHAHAHGHGHGHGHGHH